MGMRRVSDASIARPSCRKKYSRNNIITKVIRVPKTPSATEPPTAAADFNTLCAPWVSQS
jgi:hypothetical protein